MIDFTDPILSYERNLFQLHGAIDPGKQTVLIYASCHGRTLFDYFVNHRPDFTERYNLIRLETAPMKMYDIAVGPICDQKTVRDVFGAADIVVTYNMGARHGNLSLESVGRFMRKDVRILTFTAPNFSCFWPMAYGYVSNIGIHDLLDKGKTEEEVWQMFVHGDFDPMFNIRWRIEMGRLQDRDAYHDVGLVGFVQKNHKTIKLWTAGAHPGGNTMAYIGNEIMGLLEFEKWPESRILEFNYMEGQTGLQPETNYEFAHYGFTYPIRHRDDAGGLSYYRTLLTQSVDHYRSGALNPPQAD